MIGAAEKCPLPFGHPCQLDGEVLPRWPGLLHAVPALCEVAEIFHDASAFEDATAVVAQRFQLLEDIGIWFEDQVQSHCLGRLHRKNVETPTRKRLGLANMEQLDDDLAAPIVRLNSGRVHDTIA